MNQEKNKFINYLTAICSQHVMLGKPLSIFRSVYFFKGEKYNNKTIFIEFKITNPDENDVDKNTYTHEQINMVIISCLDRAILNDYVFEKKIFFRDLNMGFLHNIYITVKDIKDSEIELPIDYTPEMPPESFNNKATKIYNMIATSPKPVTKTQIANKTSGLSASLRDKILEELINKNKIKKRVKPPLGRCKKPAIIYIPVIDKPEFDKIENEKI